MDESQPTATITPEPPLPAPNQSLAPSEAETMAGWLKDDLAKGKLTPEQYRQAVTELGAGELDPKPDTRTPEQKQLDAQFPAAKPSDYALRLTPPGTDDAVLTPEMKQFDAMARTWLAGAEFPKPLGDSLIRQAEQTLLTTGKMNEAQLEAYGQAEFTKLEAVYGNTLGDKLRRAGHMVAELETKQPGLKRLLQTKGIGDSAMVASLLIQQAERYFTRRRR